MAYFPGGPPDPVLTAYVVRCLDRIRAAGFDVGSLPADLLAWLGSQQRMGMWKRVKTHGVETVERDTLEIARNLAAVGSAGDDVLMPALDALEPRVRGVMDDPWVLASWALATGPGTERGRWAVERLSGLARNEDDGVFWSPRRNLPMGGWGRASRIETTALAVRALHEAGGREDLVAAGVRFLERHRNPEGIWWTGPTSVSVLETLANSCAAPVPNPGPPSEVMGCSASTPLRRSPDHATTTPGIGPAGGRRMRLVETRPSDTGSSRKGECSLHGPRPRPPIRTPDPTALRPAGGVGGAAEAAPTLPLPPPQSPRTTRSRRHGDTVVLQVPERKGGVRERPRGRDRATARCAKPPERRRRQPGAGGGGGRLRPSDSAGDGRSPRPTGAGRAPVRHSSARNQRYPRPRFNGSAGMFEMPEHP